MVPGIMALKPEGNRIASINPGAQLGDPSTRTCLQTPVEKLQVSSSVGIQTQFGPFLSIADDRIHLAIVVDESGC